MLKMMRGTKKRIINTLLLAFILNEFASLAAKKLQCYSCSSDKLKICSLDSDPFKRNEELPFVTCPSSIASCFTKVESGVTYRGCLSNEFNATVMVKCDDTNQCTLCHSNKCNGNSRRIIDQNSIIENENNGKNSIENIEYIFDILRNENTIQSCVVCSSTDDSNCAKQIDANIQHCHKKNAKCFTHIGNVEVTRGCLSEQISEFERKCHENTDKCEICSTVDGSICNNKPFKMEMCIECSSENDEKCLDMAHKFSGKICSTINSVDFEGCYLLKTRDFVKRGCVRDLESDVKSSCLDQTDACKTCIGNNCNVMNEFQSCYVIDENSESKSLEFEQTSTKICKKYDDKCFSLVDENESIIKDCLTEYIEKKNVPIDYYAKKYPASHYQECNSMLCNNQDIKYTWCVECDFEHENGNCIDLTNTKRVKCPLEIVPSGCYHHIDGNNIQRGCMANLTKEQREICESDDEKCKKCHGNECNTKESFQKCLKTDPKNTNQTKTMICKRYTDECFTHVSNEIVWKGCMSDIIESSIDGITNCDNEIICEKCSDKDNCNDKIIQAEFCIVCSSKEISSCTYNPPIGLRKQCPLHIKQDMGCFLKKDNFSNVNRGCMSQLNMEEQNYCRDGNGYCKTCNGDSCNKKSTFQICFVCDSRNDGEECANLAWNSKDKTCRNYLDYCYIMVENGVVKRDCIGDDTIPDIESCQKAGVNCKFCDKQWCNHEVIKKGTCISCESSDKDPKCQNVIYEECPLSFHSKCYHSVDETGAIHSKGCLEKLPESEQNDCLQNGDYCKTCTGSNCNSRESFNRCLHCHSNEDKYCTISPQYAHSKICPNYNDQCFTHIGKYHVSRGCVSVEKELFQECLKNSKKCKLCTTNDGDDCNSRAITMETCVECNRFDLECHKLPDKYKNKICSEIESDDKQGCYLHVNDKFYERGCVRDLKASLATECRNQTSTCKTCMGKNCNLKQEFQQCIYCSSQNNRKCLKGDTITESHMCEKYLSTCVTGIDGHGYIHRRCSLDYSHETIEFPNNRFVVCIKNKCNTGIYPKNRLQCYRCDGDNENCDFMANTTNTRQMTICNIYSPLDQCFTYLNKDDKMYRGCLTDQSDHRLFCENDGLNKNDVCIKCPEIGCNNLPKVRMPLLSCVHCEKSVECAFGQDVDGVIKKCKKHVSFDADESCYVRYNSEEGWAERGCSLDVKNKLAPTQNIDQVVECKTSGCNYKNIKYSNCISCQSNLKGKCATLLQIDIFIAQCAGSYPYKMRGCYTMLKNKTLHRGCIKDLSKDDYENCKGDSKDCQLCEDDYCNKIPISSSAKITNSMILLTIACTIFVASHLKHRQ